MDAPSAHPSSDELEIGISACLSVKVSGVGVSEGGSSRWMVSAEEPASLGISG